MTNAHSQLSGANKNTLSTMSGRQSSSSAGSYCTERIAKCIRTWLNDVPEQIDEDDCNSPRPAKRSRQSDGPKTSLHWKVHIRHPDDPPWKRIRIRILSSDLSSVGSHISDNREEPTENVEDDIDEVEEEDVDEDDDPDEDNETELNNADEDDDTDEDYVPAEEDDTDEADDTVEHDDTNEEDEI